MKKDGTFYVVKRTDNRYVVMTQRECYSIPLDSFKQETEAYELVHYLNNQHHV